MRIYCQRRRCWATFPVDGRWSKRTSISRALLAGWRVIPTMLCPAHAPPRMVLNVATADAALPAQALR